MIPETDIIEVDVAPFAPCRHCGERKAQPERRNLCSTCHRVREIRLKYPRELKCRPREDSPVECRSCGKIGMRKVVRGLCSTCYNDKSIRNATKSTSRFAAINDPRDNVRYKAPLPREPITEPVSWERRIRILTRRASEGCTLFHPDDSPFVTEGR